MDTSKRAAADCPHPRRSQDVEDGGGVRRLASDAAATDNWLEANPVWRVETLRRWPDWRKQCNSASEPELRDARESYNAAWLAALGNVPSRPRDPDRSGPESIGFAFQVVLKGSHVEQLWTRRNSTWDPH